MTVRLYSTADLKKVVNKLQRLNVTKLSLASIEGELQDAERGLHEASKPIQKACPPSQHTDKFTRSWWKYCPECGERLSS